MMKRISKSLVTAVLLGIAIGIAVPAFAQVPAPQQSTSGPIPAPGVVSAKADLSAKSIATIDGVPKYLWRHGCGPTAVGMVLGYWDEHGYPNLIPGNASTQTDAVNQAIASGGDVFTPASPQQHFEDYAMPLDYYPNLRTDDYLASSRTPHADNCIADYANTSKSEEDNYYGWGWSSDIPTAFVNYIELVSETYAPTVGSYYWTGTPKLTFDVLKNEIQHYRPMVFLVDSDGDGSTDHFITIVGYDDGPPQKYLYHDTWDDQVHSAEFRGLSDTYEWGVWGGWSLILSGGLTFSVAVDPSQGGWKQEGDPLSLHVEATGTYGAVTYRWSKNGSDIPEATDATYSVDAVTTADAGSYRCVVQDESKASRTAGPIEVRVFPPGSLPAPGVALLLAAAAALAAIGCTRILRRDS